MQRLACSVTKNAKEDSQCCDTFSLSLYHNAPAECLFARDNLAAEKHFSFSIDMCRMSSSVLSKGEKVDIVVNNAGTTHLPAPMETIEEDEFDRVFNVNCKSVYLTAKHFVPHFKENKSGVILNIASTAGVSPRPNLNWYNSSKGWMILASKTMAVELAPFGIRVNVINPVAGETPLLKSFLGEDTPEMRGKFLSTIPLGRFSMPEDIASAALFLCSDAASMITGANLEVDGGRTI